MWRYQTGYLLHPNIDTNKEYLRIADIACGTGIWLIETARSVPASTQLDGFDISAAQFPDKGWLPQNVTLSILDSLAPLPEHLVGKYDIVHIGLVVMLIKGENPVPLLKNVMAMLSTLLLACFTTVSNPFTSLLPYSAQPFANSDELEPGGCVQWDEQDVGSLNACFPDKIRPCPHYDAIHTQSKVFFETRHVTYK